MTESEFNLTADDLHTRHHVSGSPVFFEIGLGGGLVYRLLGEEVHFWCNNSHWLRSSWHVLIEGNPKFRIVPDPSVPRGQVFDQPPVRSTPKQPLNMVDVPPVPEFEDVMFEGAKLCGCLVISEEQSCSRLMDMWASCARSVVKGFECWLHEDWEAGLIESPSETFQRQDSSYSHAAGCRRRKEIEA